MGRKVTRQLDAEDEAGVEDILRILAWGAGLVVMTLDVRQENTGRTGSWSSLSHLLSEIYLGVALVTPEREVWKMALAVPDAHSSKQYSDYGTKDTKCNRAPREIGGKRNVMHWRGKQFCSDELNWEYLA